MQKIIEVIPCDGYILKFCLSNAQWFAIDMNQKIHTLRFAGLSDKKIFNAVNTNGKTVYWPDGGLWQLQNYYR